MKRLLKLGFVAGIAIVGFSGCTKPSGNHAVKSSENTAHEDPDGFYTCSMHPQVHQHKAGACPICGMALVKVDNKKEAKPESEVSHEIPAGPQRLNLAGIGKHTVVRKDLNFSIPVFGRTTSPREVVFQVYESDLQSVKTGSSFEGSGSASPGQVVKGEIRRVDNLVDPSSRTVRVIGTLSAPVQRFVVDGAFHATINSSVTRQIAVPVEAVLHAGQRDLVYVFTKDANLKPVAVTLGQKTRDEYQVLSGLNEGDVISSGPNFLIDSEAKIRGVGDQTHH